MGVAFWRSNRGELQAKVLGGERGGGAAQQERDRQEVGGGDGRGRSSNRGKLQEVVSVGEVVLQDEVRRAGGRGCSAGDRSEGGEGGGRGSNSWGAAGERGDGSGGTRKTRGNRGAGGACGCCGAQTRETCRRRRWRG